MTRRLVLVTGASGFVGRHLCQRLMLDNVEVVGTHRPGSDADVDWPSVGVDLASAKAMRGLLNRIRPTDVVHLAGCVARGSDAASWSQNLRDNVGVTAHLLEAVVGASGPQPAIVMVGSQAEYGSASAPWTESSVCRPSGPYGATKLAASELIAGAIRGGDITGCVVRLPIVFGPGQDTSYLIPAIITGALTGNRIAMTPGTQTRCFVGVGDVARTISEMLALLRTDADLPLVVNAPAHAPMTVAELGRLIIERCGGAGELGLGDLPFRPNEMLEAFPDDALARRLGLAEPEPLEGALASTVEWYRAQ